MELGISAPAVVAATATGLAIAWVWYSDWGVVGRGVWRGLTGVTPEDSARAGRRPLAVLLVAIAATAVALAGACSLASSVLGRDSLGLHLAVGCAAWLGLSLTTLVQHNAFEQKPVRLTTINGAYQLVLFAGMSLAIGLAS
ncbi:DUF1761 domain-containing protein [Agilicoccus flavus]|uniref:DUF1761 domain-containing protein n=1 Tax=Agilicoccus flavus TaxID=2775968 RepID=UPI001CF675D0|nr:DUF1761 domain-containing protein [Agilicoccus flavus]